MKREDLNTQSLYTWQDDACYPPTFFLVKLIDIPGDGGPVVAADVNTGARYNVWPSELSPNHTGALPAVAYYNA
jgi:hypothetical protein